MNYLEIIRHFLVGHKDGGMELEILVTKSGKGGGNSKKKFFAGVIFDGLLSCHSLNKHVGKIGLFFERNEYSEAFITCYSCI